jgi:altronate hydrolase
MDNILIIHSKDNVGVALRAIAGGEQAVFGGRDLFVVLEEIPASHKVALRDIAGGEEIIKYGEPVAVSTKLIRQGQWVHTHNLQSGAWKK